MAGVEIIIICITTTLQLFWPWNLRIPSTVLLLVKTNMMPKFRDKWCIVTSVGLDAMVTLTHQTRCFSNSLNLFQVSIWLRAQRKHFKKESPTKKHGRWWNKPVLTFNAEWDSNSSTLPYRYKGMILHYTSLQCATVYTLKASQE